MIYFVLPFIMYIYLQFDALLKCNICLFALLFVCFHIGYYVTNVQL